MPYLRKTGRETVLISGAGIAGPTLAYWLLARGFAPTIVERAPKFREGGYIIDFWGVGYDIAERMGLIPALRTQGYINDRAAFVRADGRERSGFGGDVLRRSMGERFLSIQRGDLARIIFDQVADRVETLFGDEIADLAQYKNGVDVRFASGQLRTFDMVVGADGLRSKVRSAVFSERDVFVHYLGYYAAAFVCQGYRHRDEHVYLSYAEPGRQVSRFALRDGQTGFLFVFRRKDRDLDFNGNLFIEKEALCHIYSSCKWDEWPEIRVCLRGCSELYFDAVAQVRAPYWSTGRVALVGDAAYSPSLLAGEGAALAMVGACTLAGELERADGDHGAAFQSYEQRLRPFLERRQKSARAFAPSFTPATEFGLFVRDGVLNLTRIPIVADWLLRYFLDDTFELPVYD